MPRFNVELNGKWSCYSGISDEFITPFMPLDEFERWRDDEYGRLKVPLEESNKMTFAEAVREMLIYQCDDNVAPNLRYALGLGVDDDE